jgi:seryl-tRNA synthetase
MKFGWMSCSSWTSIDGNECRVEEMKARRKRQSKEIGALMAQGKGIEAEALKAETRDWGDQIAAGHAA